MISPGSHYCEKNWLAYQTEDHAYRLLYHPTRSYNLTPVVHQMLGPQTPSHAPRITLTGERQSPPTPMNMSRLRQSAGPVRYTYGKELCWLILVHDVVLESADPPNRIYLQRFQVLNADEQVVAMSLPFYLIHKGIEYVSGLSIDDAYLYLGVGFRDLQALVVKISITELHKRLRPITDWYGANTRPIPTPHP
jgi:hypothetical protein